MLQKIIVGGNFKLQAKAYHQLDEPEQFPGGAHRDSSFATFSAAFKFEKYTEDSIQRGEEQFSRKLGR